LFDVEAPSQSWGFRFCIRSAPVAASKMGRDALLQRVFDIAARLLPVKHNPTHNVLTDFVSYVILMHMSMTGKPETVWFTTKGQVVIPLRLRKQFDIEDGTKAVVQATPEGILLKPMTAALIKRGRGILKRTPGGKPLREDWAEHKKQERALEGRYAG
jgi:AbrB family looped-hinge helix DNA binding protein